MTSTVNVILDFSPGTQELIERHRLDIYRAIQEELPTIRLGTMSDPAAPSGSKDLATIIIVTSGLITALTPLVIRILNQFKPDTTEFVQEEIETHHPDDTVTIHRIRIYTKREYNQGRQLPQIPKKAELPDPESRKDPN